MCNLIAQNNLLRVMYRRTGSIPQHLPSSKHASHEAYKITLTTLNSIYTLEPLLEIV